MKNILNLLAVILAGAALMAGLWMVMKPQPQSVPGVVVEPVVHEFGFELKAGAVLGPDILQVQEGDRVRIVLQSDVDEELHLHGYDLKGRVAPGSPLVLDFVAQQSGRFDLELHGAHHAIGSLEVYPRP